MKIEFKALLYLAAKLHDHIAPKWEGQEDDPLDMKEALFFVAFWMSFNKVL